MTVLYVDVSQHDRFRRGAPLDWDQIRQATSPVMIARASYGDPETFHPDSFFFDEFHIGARNAGFVLRGGYHNLIRGDTASMARQVDVLRQRLDQFACDWAMADVEPYSELVANGLWPRWEDTLRFRDRWYTVEQRPISWYIPRWFWQHHTGAPSLGEPDLTELPGALVQSAYFSGDGTAAQLYERAGADQGFSWSQCYGGRCPDLWQYSSEADVAGASVRTDVNAFRGDLAVLHQLLTGGAMWTQEQINAVMWTLVHDPSGPIHVRDTLMREQLDRIEAKMSEVAALFEQCHQQSGDV